MTKASAHSFARHSLSSRSVRLRAVLVLTAAASMAAGAATALPGLA